MPLANLVPGPPASVLSEILRTGPVFGPVYGQSGWATFSGDGDNYPYLPSLMTDEVFMSQSGVLDANVSVTGVLVSQGWATQGVTEVDANYTTLPTDAVILADAASAAITITLADATTPGYVTGQRYTIKKTDSSANTVTVVGTNGQLIDGLSSAVLGPTNAETSVVFDGADWWVWSGVTALTTSLVLVTPAQSANYAASAGQFVPCNVSAGGFTVTLPNAPQNGTTVGAKIIVTNGSNVLTVACAGSDVFDTVGGPTTKLLDVLNQSIIFQYRASVGIWYGITGDATGSLVPSGDTTGATDSANIVTALGSLASGAVLQLAVGNWWVNAPIAPAISVSIRGQTGAMQSGSGSPGVGTVINVASGFAQGGAAANAVFSMGLANRQDIRSLWINGQSNSGSGIDGINWTTGAGASVVEVGVNNMSGWGMNLVGGLGAYVSTAIIQGCTSGGLTSHMADTYLENVHAQNNNSATQNGIEVHAGDTRLVACRADGSGGSGYLIAPFNATSALGIGAVLVGCATEGNQQNGVLCSGGGGSTYGPIQIVGCQLTGDGQNGGSGGGGYAGVACVGRVQVTLTDVEIGGGGGNSTTVASGSNGGTISSIASWSSPSGGVLDVASTSGFASSGTLLVAASGDTSAIVNYTNTSGGNSFTGCTYVSGSPSGTVATGGNVASSTITYPEYALATAQNSGTHAVPDLVEATGGMWQAATALVNDAGPATKTYLSPSVWGVVGAINGTAGVTTFTQASTATTSGQFLVTPSSYTAATIGVASPTLGTFGLETTVASGSNGGTIANIATWSSPSGGVLDVASTSGFPTSGTILVVASGSTVATVTYTNTSGGNSFTGCAYVSGSPSGTVATGNAVILSGASSVLSTGSFTAPTSGSVLVTATFTAQINSGTKMMVALTAHGTVTPVLGNSVTWNDGTANIPRAYTARFSVTGLTAGNSYNFDLCGAANSGFAATVNAEGLTSTSIGNAGSPVIMTVQAV